MSWQQWALVAVFASSALVSVGTIGRKRESLTPRDAVFMILIDVGLIALVVTA